MLLFLLNRCSVRDSKLISWSKSRSRSLYLLFLVVDAEVRFFLWDSNFSSDTYKTYVRFWVINRTKKKKKKEECKHVCFSIDIQIFIETFQPSQALASDGGGGGGGGGGGRHNCWYKAAILKGSAFTVCKRCLFSDNIRSSYRFYKL